MMLNEEIQNSYKIIISGPVASGKTTAINTLSDITTVSTEEIATDQTKDIKQDTTVAMDYGMLEMPDGSIVHLYGTPGQERFNYMWEILAEGSLGLLILINNKSKTPFDDLDYYINAFSSFIGETSLAIGVTNMDSVAEPSIDQYNKHLHSKGKNYPVLDTDARDERDMKILLQALLYSLC